MADTHELVHRRADHVLCDDHRTGHAENLSETGLAVLIDNLGEVFLCICEGTSHVVSIVGERKRGLEVGLSDEQQLCGADGD